MGGESLSWTPCNQKSRASRVATDGCGFRASCGAAFRASQGTSAGHHQRLEDKLAALDLRATPLRRVAHVQGCGRVGAKARAGDRANQGQIGQWRAGAGGLGMARGPAARTRVAHLSWRMCPALAATSNVRAENARLSLDAWRLRLQMISR